MAANKTPPAAKSFTAFIDGCMFFLHAKSDKVSIAVFIASKAKTKPITTIIANHSWAAILNKKPSKTAKIAIIRWIYAFGVFLKSVFIPPKAYTNDLIRFLKYVFIRSNSCSIHKDNTKYLNLSAALNLLHDTKQLSFF